MSKVSDTRTGKDGIWKALNHVAELWDFGVNDGRQLGEGVVLLYYLKPWTQRVRQGANLRSQGGGHL